ncbi:hypothetical protein Y032_0700g1637 [Ancylostoma ceylanicum]|uniref:Cilia- and flagella-associated protein 52 n=2 Tax=Ancylostoma ceylanicum TaxID=53326 RepID=A0A016WI75_9BILA|nr:hypothetical protein Y032_0700g1637 [Ancylostoma ceylanicum]
MSVPMFERGNDMKLTVGSISAFPSNLSVCYLETRSTTYACVVQKTQVHTVNWDNKNESVSWDSINISDTSTDKPVNVLQAAFVLPNARTLPLLVVGTMCGAQIFDIRTQKLLQRQNIDIGLDEPDDSSFWNSFCRGISCNDNTILIGTSFGHIIQFLCTGETSISSKKCLKEHSASIADITTCRYDEITCSGDCSGTIIVWSKNIKGVQLKIATQHPITVMNILRKQVIVGTVRGRVLFYSVSGGELMAEVCAHARSVTCISVAPESAYVLTGSEDGRFIVYKLHTRKPQAYQVEYRFSDELPNCAIMGAQFTNGRGSNIAVACFDHNAIYGYRIVKKASV